MSMTAARPESVAANRFTLHYGAWLLLLVFIGFGPTFFWRPLSTSEPLPSWGLVAHGVVNSAWMLLFVAQSGLVLAGQRRLHRHIGVAAAIVGAISPVLGLAVVGESARRHAAVLLQPENQSARFALAAPMFGTVLFVAFLTAALYHRHRRDHHARLMLLATMQLTMAVAGRLPLLRTVRSMRGLLAIALLAPILLHDWRRHGRIHVTNRWGIPLVVGTTVAAAVFARSRAFDVVIRWLAA